MPVQSPLEGGQPSPEVRFKHLSGRFQRGQIRRPPAGRNLINRVDNVVAATFVAAGFWQRSALVLKPALSVHPGSLLHHCPRRCMTVYVTMVSTIVRFREIIILIFLGFVTLRQPSVSARSPAVMTIEVAIVPMCCNNPNADHHKEKPGDHKAPSK